MHEMIAFKRWEAFLAHPNSVGFVSIGGACVKYDDLRAVLALAREASKLKRRVRLALRLVTSANGDDVQRGLRLLDLRRPLGRKC